MAHTKGLRLSAALLAVLVWQGAAMALDNPLLLAAPLQVAARLLALLPTGGFWLALGRSFTRIVAGFLLALGLSAALAALSARFPLAETLLRPYVSVIRSVPVASFIVIALLWLSAERLSVFISFLMVFPVLYTGLLQGLREADPALREVAAVFRMSPARRIRAIYVPAVRPWLLSGARSGLGLCWKAGVAAEVIAAAADTVGGRLYDAKVYVQTADLFAWTAVIVAVSAGFERLFLRLAEWALDRWEGRE